MYSNYFGTQFHQNVQKKAYQFYWRRIERHMLNKYTQYLFNLFILYTNYIMKIVVNTTTLTIFTNIKRYLFSIALDIKDKISVGYAFFVALLHRVKIE